MTYLDTPGFKPAGPGSEAAQKVTRHAATVRDRVLQFLQSEHPANFAPAQIASRLGISFLSVRPRVSEFHLRSEPDGTSRKNDSGMSAQCCLVAKLSDGGSH